MKQNYIYFGTVTFLTISIVLSLLTNNLTHEQIEKLPLFNLYFIDLLLFLVTSILISASLTLFSRNHLEYIIQRIFFVFLMGLISSFAYFILATFTFQKHGSGDSGMIGQAIVVVGGGMIVFIIAIVVSFITILLKPRMKIIDENGVVRYK